MPCYGNKKMARQISVLFLVCFVTKSWAQNTSCPMGYCLIQGQCYVVITLGLQCSSTQQCVCNSDIYAGMTAGPGTACDAADSRCPGSGLCLYNGQCYKVLQNGGTCETSETCMCLGARSTIGPNGQTTPPQNMPSSCDPTDPQCPGGATDCRLNGQCYTILGVGAVCPTAQQCTCSPVGQNGPAASCIANDPTCPAGRCLYNGQCYTGLPFGSSCATTDQCVCLGDGIMTASCDNNDMQCPGSLNCRLNGQCYSVLGAGAICSTTQQCICSGVGQAGPAFACDPLDTRCPGSGSCLYNGQCYRVMPFGGTCATTDMCVCIGGSAPTVVSRRVMVGHMMRSLWQSFKCSVLDMDC